MQIRNLNFNVRTFGNGTLLVWAHDLLSSMELEDRLDWFQWGTWPPALKLVRYDARGHGQTQATSRPDDYEWRSLGQDMLAVAQAAGEHSFMAGGVAQGAATALQAALLSAGRVQALVLVAPPPIWDKREAVREGYERRARRAALPISQFVGGLAPSRPEELLPRWLIERDPEKYGQAPEALAGLSGRTLAAILRGAAASDLPTREVVAGALRDVPALIIAWADDPAHPTWSAEELRLHLPKSELFVAKHVADFETIPQRIRRFITTTLHYQPPPIHF
jgi:pimeloyl-ACP methyl ester carboxylesterase